MLGTPPQLCSEEIPCLCTLPFHPLMLNSPSSYGWCRKFWERLAVLCGRDGSGRFPHNALKFLSFRRNSKEALNFPDYEKSLFFSSKEWRDDCECFPHLDPSMNAPSGFHRDGSPLLNAHNPVGCSCIDWLCPLLLISAGTERKALHAVVVPNSISNLEIAECIYKSLYSNLLNPWSPVPLELSHSTLLPHITYQEFCVPSPCSCFPLYQVWFLMHIKVSLRPGCHYCPRTLPEEYKLPTADKVQAWLSSK